jgi:cytochrome b
MAEYLDVPLHEYYLPWKTLEPFYGCYGPLMRIGLGILVLACLFVWFVASLDSPHSKEFLLIGSGLISMYVLMLIWGGWSGYQARRRAVSRSVLQSSLLD